MALDGIVVRALVHELDQTLTEGRIDKVTQPDPSDIILHISKNRVTVRLLISVNPSCPRVGITNEKRENPSTAPLLCMLLRKHLTGGRIVRVVQQGMDRIIAIDVESRDEMGFPTENRIHIELMGKHSNMILYNLATGRIFDSINRISESMSRVRQVHPGLFFEPLPTHKVPLLGKTAENLQADLQASTGRNLSSAMLETFEGFSPLICRQLIHQTGLDDEPRENWTPHLLAKICKTLETFSEALAAHRYSPCMVRLSSGTPLDFSVLHLNHLIFGERTEEIYTSVSELLEIFFREKSREARLKNKSISMRKLLGTRIARLEKKMQKLQEDYHYAENAEESRIIGDLLTSNLYLISRGMNAVTVTDFFDPEQGQRTIALDVRLTPSENVQRYYKKYNKLKTAMTQVLIQLEETRHELAYLDTVMTAIDTSHDPSDIDAIHAELASQGYAKAHRKERGKKKEKDTFNPIRYKTPEGLEILVGRNNLENDRLTLKFASNSDVWLHTKEIPGSHVILRTQGCEASQHALLLAAEIAAWHSKGRNGENIAVDYALVRHVRKPAGARPGMVIYDHQKTVYITPDEKHLTGAHDPIKK